MPDPQEAADFAGAVCRIRIVHPGVHVFQGRCEGVIPIDDLGLRELRDDETGGKQTEQG